MCDSVQPTCWWMFGAVAKEKNPFRNGVPHRSDHYGQEMKDDSDDGAATRDRCAHGKKSNYLTVTGYIRTVPSTLLNPVNPSWCSCVVVCCVVAFTSIIRCAGFSGCDVAPHRHFHHHHQYLTFPPTHSFLNFVHSLVFLPFRLRPLVRCCCYSLVGKGRC